MIQSLVILDDLYSGQYPTLKTLEDGDFSYCLKVADLPQGDYNYRYRGKTIHCTGDLPVDGVPNDISLYNLKWVLTIAPTAGWAPSWRDPCLVGVVLVALVISVLLMGILVVQERHARVRLFSSIPSSLTLTLTLTLPFVSC